MKKILVILSLWGIGVFCFAQTTISGKVVDASGQPMIGANISVQGTYMGTTTNSQGEFTLKNVGPGPFTLSISYVGYEDNIQHISPQENSEIDVILSEKSILTEEVVIRGVRAGQNAPVAQTTLQRKAIQLVYNGEHPVFFISDLTPSVTTESESGTSFANYGSMRLRGLDQHRINITLNGVPLNDMIDHGVYFSNFTDIGNSFESVQVQRGVGTSSNGVASFAGSINFESVNLQKLAAGSEVQVGYGSFNSSRLNGQFNSGMVNEHWSFHGSFSRIYSDGYKDHTQTNAYSFFFSGGYFGKKHTVKLNTFDARSKNGLGYEAVDLATIKKNPTFNPLNENDIDDFGQQFVQLQHIYQVNSFLNMVSSAYYNGSGGDFPWGYVDSVLIQYNYPLTNKHVGFISNINYTGINNLELSGGMHAYTFYRNNLEQVSPDFKNPYYDETSQKDELSLFAKATFRAGDLSIYGDVQLRSALLTVHPDFSYLGIDEGSELSKSWNFINPKFGMSYAFTTKTNVYASVGVMGREPRKVDILGGYGLYDAGSYVELKDGIDFLHETVTDVEAGIKHFDQKLSVELNLFHMNFKNGILESGEIIEFGSKVRNNVPKAYRTGVEMSLAYKPIEKLQFVAHGTYMKSKIEKFRFVGDSDDTKGLVPILSPEVILNGTLRYNLLKNIQVSMTGKYVGDSYLTLDNDVGFILPSYFVLNGRISTLFLSKHSFMVEINNLTSAEYYGSGAALDQDWDGVVDTPGYFANAPINFFASFTFRF